MSGHRHRADGNAGDQIRLLCTAQRVVAEDAAVAPNGGYLINTMDPELVAAAFGVNPGGVMIYRRPRR